MTNPIINPQPNYSGVTIQISNPAVYAGQCDGKQHSCVSCGQIYANGVVPQQDTQYISNAQNMTNPVQNTGYPNAYPAQYYLNNYGVNNGVNGVNGVSNSVNNGVNNDASDKVESKEPERVANNTYEKINSSTQQYEQNNNVQSENYNGTNAYQMYADREKSKNEDLTKSQNIIGDIAEREAEIKEEKKNTKETKIVALTDEYIKSLENYLNNPNDEIRIMASKEILTRLDEDKDRYDDAALNALLNKMLQDPNKLVRIAALSAFGSQLASGNDYTVNLLQNIQSNPNADKEDVLQAADILLKMSAGVEVKNIPNPKVKETKQQ